MGEHPNGFDQNSGHNGRGTLNPPEVDIPVLKKQEKEKKGMGAILPGGVPGGGALTAGVNAGQAAGFMTLFAGKAGLAALALGVVGAGAIGVGLMGGGSGERKAASPQLDGLESNISVDRRNAVGSKSLSYMAKAGSGQLKWDDPNAPKPQAGAESKSDAPADTPAGEGLDEAGAGAEGGEGEGGDDKPRLSGGLSGAKLSSSLGGSGAFGKNNIFAKGSGFNIKSSDLKAKSGIQGGASRLTASAKGNLGGMSRGKSNARASSKSTSRIRGNGALGQLKFAGTRSQAAAKAGESGAASTFAADAFDQQKTAGGSLEAGAGGIGDGLGTVNPSGGSAPDVTGGETGCPEGWGAAEGGGCTAPDITNGVDQTKYQGLLDGVLQMQKAAQQMMMIGIALIAIGVGLVATGFLSGVGWALIAAGAGMLLMAQMMNKQADQMADQIGSMYNQKKQADVLKARGEGDSSTPELEERRLEEQKKAAEGPGYEEDLTTTEPEAQPE